MSKVCLDLINSHRNHLQPAIQFHPKLVIVVHIEAFTGIIVDIHCLQQRCPPDENSSAAARKIRGVFRWKYITNISEQRYVQQFRYAFFDNNIW